MHVEMRLKSGCNLLLSPAVLNIGIIILTVFVSQSDSANKSSKGGNSSKKDLYAILGVPKTATDKEIKKAYRKLAIKYHPDKVKPEDAKEAEEQFILINKAHEILGDKEKRAQYDKYGENAFDGTGQAKYGGGGSGFGGFEFHSSDFFDRFFDDHFRNHHFQHSNFHEDHQRRHRENHERAARGHAFHHGEADGFGGFDGFFDGFGDMDDGGGSFESFSFSTGGGMGQNCRTETIIRGNSRSTTTICS
ncbi:uncharacterized protein LOC142338623 [Convolutriloba macropyga]|uniref:uncharacterized protein LOC142338623 n=1 Tax=Convolutriloba macropyga TaxID=536237 RepID=UPI003F51F9CA